MGVMRRPSTLLGWSERQSGRPLADQREAVHAAGLSSVGSSLRSQNLAEISPRTLQPGAGDEWPRPCYLA